jgi:Flp pilus assembly pilin Flp
LRSSWSNSSFSRLRRDERGQGLVEYALILLLVSVGMVLALAALGADVSGLVESVTDKFP